MASPSTDVTNSEMAVRARTPDGVSPEDGRSARIAAMLADQMTPLIRNCWYVAATSAEIGAALLARRILGTALVLYRAGDGHAVALHDRCPHRSLPLSRGTREGDSIRCGYHGLVFDAGGACTEIPGQDAVMQRICVPSFPVRERAPLVWVWMGDPALADEALIPALPWLSDPGWTHVGGAMHLAASYVPLHENLLDLTHFTYLHPGNLGTPEYAQAPFSVTTSGDTVEIARRVERCDVPAMYAATGLGTKKISRHTVSVFRTPAFHDASAVLTDLAPEPGGRAAFNVRVSHFATPETQESTHYVFFLARDFAVDDREATEAMRRGVMKAFTEDKDALEEIARTAAAEPGFREINIRSDQAGIAMRRAIRRLADREGAVPGAD